MRNATRSHRRARQNVIHAMPQMYEGKECIPTCSVRAHPGRQCDDFHPMADQERRQEDLRFPAPIMSGATLNVYARKVIEANGGEVSIFENTIRRLASISVPPSTASYPKKSKDVVFNTVIRRASAR